MVLHFNFSRIKIIQLKNMLLFIWIFLITGCGPLSEIIEVNFYNSKTTMSQMPSSPYFGLASSFSRKKSDSYILEASIGEFYSKPYQSKDRFTFYGGIQGQVMSR